MKNPTWALLVFGLVWSSITLLFDVFSFRSLFGQWRSTHFEATNGRILFSEVTTSQGSESTTYGVRINYMYEVRGQRYASSRVRFGQMSDSGGKWARQTVGDNPVGATRPVFFDPADPAMAVLQRGIGGQDLFLALFLAPFNAVMLGLWWGGLALWRKPPPNGGAIIAPEGGELRVRFPGLGPIASALGVFGLTAFLAMMPLAIFFGFSPPREWVVAAGLLTLAAAAGSALWQRRQHARAEPDLIISLERSTLTRLNAPQVPGGTRPRWREWKNSRRTPLVVPLERIASVDVREQVVEDSDSKTTTYLVVAVVGREDGGPSEDLALASWTFSNRADAFAAWLRTTLGLV